MGKSRPTLKDVAEATGFSANTVSLALRGSPRLPEATRQRILEVAERLNYAPNRIARSLASSATGTIGLIMTDILNPTLTLTAHTIERELSKAGYAVMFAASDANVEYEKRAIGLFQSYQVDGMLIYPANRNEFDHLKRLDASGTPVLLLVDIPDAGLDTVTIDDNDGAFRALGHLCQMGHRTIAMVDGGRSAGNLDKWAGAQRALREQGLPLEGLSVFEPSGHAPSDAYDLMNEIVSQSPRPTAVFATTDSLAVGVLHWCRDNDVSVPDQLAVIGYDNTQASRHSVPPLTTVNYAADEISRIGVKRILQRLDATKTWDGPTTSLIQADLILRNTV